jgi:hypothetical protein
MRGDKIRWPGAASETAYAVNKGTYAMFGKADEFLETGNGIIFDNVFSKLRERMSSDVLTQGQAQLWDEKVLAEEQNLVQGLYDKAVSGGYYDSLARAATWDGAWAGINGAASVFGWSIPAMGGELSNVDDRWSYGMSRMGYETYGRSAPTVGKGYIDGSLLQGFLN